MFIFLFSRNILINHLYVHYKMYLYSTGIIGIQLLCIPIYFMISSGATFSIMRSMLGTSFSIARMSAHLININLFLAILPMIKFYRRIVYVPIKREKMHVLPVFFLYFWSVVHTIAHFVNFKTLNLLCKCTKLGPGYTGILMLIGLVVIGGLSANSIIRRWYDVFWIIHVITFFSIILLLNIHNTFCFIRNNDNSCITKMSWIFTLVPTLVYCIENITRYFAVTSIQNVTKYNDVIQVEFLSTRIKNRDSGSVVYICCPSVSVFEWHPFSLTSNSFENYSTVHFKQVGDWTTKFTNRLGITENGGVMKTVAPQILLDGPYKCIRTALLNDTNTSNILILTTGMGMTSFAAFIKETVSFQPEKLEKIKLIWITRSYKDLAWIKSYLDVISDKLHVRVYLTKEFWSESGSGGMSSYIKEGKPDIESLLDSYQINNLYYSGNKELEKKIVSYTAKKGKGIKLYM